METNQDKNQLILSGFPLSKKTILVFIKLLIAAGLITYLILNVDPEKILLSLKSVNILLLIFAFLLLGPNIYLQYLKWKIICRKFSVEDDNGKIFSSLLMGFAAGVFTPGRLGEFFGRSLQLKDKSLIKIALLTFIDKIFPLISVIIFGLISFLIFYNNSLNAYYFLILLSSIIFISVLIKFLPVNHLLRFVRSFTKGEIFLHKIKFLKELDKKTALILSIISFLFYLCFTLQFVVLISAFTGKFLLYDYFIVVGLIMIVKAIIPSVSFGEIGIREGAAIYFLTQIGETSAAAFNASMLLFFINLLLPSLAGLFFLLRKND